MTTRTKPVQQDLPDGTPGEWVWADNGWSLQPVNHCTVRVWETTGDVPKGHWKNWYRGTESEMRDRYADLTRRKFRAQLLSPTGAVIDVTVAPCEYCGTTHPGTSDGLCLL